MPRWIPFFATAALLVGCQKKAAEAPGGGRGGAGGPVPVLAGEAVQKPMAVTANAIGNVRPVETVSIKPQVGGPIREVQFQEGQEVKKGDLLFTIDARPFEVSLAEAEARLTQAQAQQGTAQNQAQRYTSLSKTGVVAKEQTEQLQSSAQSLTAGVLAAEAAVKAAKLQVEYSQVRAPISGRAGQRLVDLGNVVTANTTEMVVINKIEPIEVRFAVPERYLPQVREYSAKSPLPVRATPQGDAARAAQGELTFIDNAVKPASGTVELKATFPNADRALWPGQFVDVTLTLMTQPEAVVVPSQAVQSSQKGQYVFVIKPDSTAEQRSVKLDRTMGAESVISEGLKAGERVVLDGHLRLTPGAKVQVKTVAPQSTTEGVKMTKAE